MSTARQAFLGAAPNSRKIPYVHILFARAEQLHAAGNLADAKTDKVIGCHIIGPSAGDLIAEVVLGMEFSAAAEDIARTSHAHPSLAEAVKEAALAVDGRPIHI